MFVCSNSEIYLCVLATVLHVLLFISSLFVCITHTHLHTYIIRQLPSENTMDILCFNVRVIIWYYSDYLLVKIVYVLCYAYIYIWLL